jgi:hypothetical protein
MTKTVIISEIHKVSVSVYFVSEGHGHAVVLSRLVCYHKRSSRSGISPVIDVRNVKWLYVSININIEPWELNGFFVFRI